MGDKDANTPIGSTTPSGDALKSYGVKVRFLIFCRYYVKSTIEKGGHMVNIGLLIIRVVIGLTFIGHGCQKLFGWFGGGGLSGTGAWLESLGIRPASKIWAVLAGLFELIGGILFGSGRLLPVGSILIVIIMIDAIVTVHAKNGFWIDKGGYEYNLVLIAVVIGIALIGPGTYIL